MRSTRAWLAGTSILLALGITAPGLAAQDEEEPELRGDVVSAETGEPIAGAWVAMQGYGYGTYSRREGDFRLPDVPSAPRRYDVRAIGYLSDVLTLDPASGEQVIELEPDDSVLPGLEFLLAHLEDRLNGGRSFDREALAFSGAFDLGELLEGRGVRRIRRFCLDEELAPGLHTADPGTFYRVEVHGSTIRAYSQEFLERTAREDPRDIEQIVRLRTPRC